MSRKIIITQKRIVLSNVFQIMSVADIVKVKIVAHMVEKVLRDGENGGACNVLYQDDPYAVARPFASVSKMLIPGIIK